MTVKQSTERWMFDKRSIQYTDGYLVVRDSHDELVANIAVKRDAPGTATKRSYLIAAAPAMLDALTQLLSERPPCHLAVLGQRCSSCDWCFAEQVIALSKGG